MRQLSPIEGCAGCVLGRAAPCPFHETRHPAGKVLVAQGEVPDRAWLVRRGTVLVTSISGGGAETQCALRGPGSLIGLEALRHEEAPYQAWTLSDVVTCSLSADRLCQWVGPRENPVGVVLDLALNEVGERGEERTALAGRCVERLARFLVARRRLERHDRPLRIQHQLLARMLGMRAETLSRAVGKLRDAGAIEEGFDVRIRDWERLLSLAGDIDGLEGVRGQPEPTPAPDAPDHFQRWP